MYSDCLNNLIVCHDPKWPWLMPRPSLSLVLSQVSSC